MLDTLLHWLSNGLLDLSVVGVIVATLAMTHFTIVGVTVYLHRHSAHRALDLHPALAFVFRFWLWLSTGMETKEWTAIHRKHHVDCETEEDPHSPQIVGLKKILWEGAEAYREAAKKPEIMEQYGAGTPEDWFERNVFTRFSATGVVLMLIINLALFGVLGLTVWAIQMIWIPLFAAGVINGIGHYWGYRNFECPDQARNVSPWGILIGGEELHNNHHTYPNSAKLSQKWWEFDIGWFWIRLFEMLGLAKARSTGPVVAKDPAKTDIDTDTVWGVLNDRFRVMAHYAEDVVMPMVKREYSNADAETKRLLKRASAVLCREDSLVDDDGRDQIAAVVAKVPEIKVIYDLRVQLQAIWSKRGGDVEETLGALKAWCAAAEATGLQHLSDFVAELRSYTIPKLATA